MAYNPGRPTTAELYAVPTAPQPSSKAQCPPWSKQYVASPERRKKRRQPPRHGRGRGRGRSPQRALPRIKPTWDAQPHAQKYPNHLEAALQDLRQKAANHSPEVVPKYKRAAHTYDKQNKQALIDKRKRLAGKQKGDYWDKMLHPAQREAMEGMRKYRAERRAQNASPKEALLSQAKQQLASLDDPNLKKIMSGLIEELSPQRSLRPPPLQPLRPDATERAPAGMTPGGFRTPGVSPSKRVSFDLSPKKHASFSAAVAPPAPAGSEPSAWDWGSWHGANGTPYHRSNAVSPLGPQTPAAPLSGPKTPAADDAPPVAWGASRPAFDESDDDDDDMWWPAPAKAPRPRSVRFADTVTETPAGDDSEDRAVDAFRSFLTAFDGERARQRKGLEACAARTMR